MAGEGDEAAATMKDLKEVQTTLTSLMDTRMNELRGLIAQLRNAPAAAPGASSAPHDNSSENVNEEDEEANEGETGDRKSVV